MSKTLLLADDSVTIQKVVGISFANEDVVLVTVDNGDDAIAQARETRPDIVLADVVMPGKSGYEVCEAIKGDPALAHVPVLLLTGTFEAFDEARASAAGADGHITKPFEAQALVDTVNARLAEAPSPAAAPAATPVPADEPFDFLEDVGTEPSGAATPDAARTTMIMGEDLGSSDEAFSFDGGGNDDEPEMPLTEVDAHAETQTGFAPMVEEPSNEHTQLLTGADEISPDLANAETLPPVENTAAPDTSDLGDSLFGDDDAADATSVVLTDSPTDVPELETDADDFGAALDLDAQPEDDAIAAPAEPVGGIDPLADSGADAEALLDPDAGHDYDVSSSDLGDAFADPAASLDGPEAAELQPAEGGGFVLVTPEEAATDPVAGDALVGAETAADPLEASDPGPFAAPMAAGPEIAEPVFEAPAAPEAAPIEPVAAPTKETPQAIELGESPALALLSEETDAATELPPALMPGAPASTPDLSPMMREQLHDALEKVAWEAFGDVAERIVHDALARVEEIAWEVIPKMAEALIQEEIRKMKAED